MAKQVFNPSEVALDFSNVKPFEPLDPGQVYLCSVSKLTIGTSKSNNPKVSLELTILGPEEAQVEEWISDGEGAWASAGLAEKDGEPVMTKASGRKLFREYSLMPDALPFLHEFIRAANPEAVLDDKFIFAPADYIGLEVAAKINNEAYEEQIRPRVRRILPATAFQS